MTQAAQTSYLDPYRKAIAQHGDGIGSLLWCSERTQAARFGAIARLYDFAGQSMLDAGCGRADLLDYLVGRGIRPDHYIGLEALGEFAEAARAKGHPQSQIVVADFVREPARLLTGADAIVFCGSLNTLDAGSFHSAIRTAAQAAVEVVVFNFLCSTYLAGAPWLTWHRASDVMAFARTLGGRVELLDDYLEGDATIAIYKDGQAP